MQCYDGRGHPCHEPAAYRLLTQDGTPVPGGYKCERHAREVLNEYRQKLGWRWRAVRVDEFGRPVPDAPVLLGEEGQTA